MKTFAAIVCLLVIGTCSQALEIPEVYLKHFAPGFAKCMGMEMPSDGATASLKEKMAMTNEHDQGCAIACVMKQGGMMKASVLDSEVLKGAVKTIHTGNDGVVSDMQKVVDVCVDQVKTVQDECDLALQYVKCYLEKYHA